MTTCQRQVTGVIVTFRSRHTIGATLDALLEAHGAGLAEVVVVDNSSNDGTADFVAEHYPWVTLVRDGGNVGFGKGCNRGLEYVTTPYALLLNPDAVISFQALTTLLDFMNGHPRVGICGPAVVEASGDLQPAGGLPTPWKIMLKPLWPRWASRGRRLVVPGEASTATDWICGSIMLLRSAMIKEVGEFDPRFFLYFEETDLCLRAQESGWELWTVGEAVCGHINAASAKATNDPMIWGTLSEHYFKSRFYYLVKHFGWPLAVIAEIGELSFMFVRATADLARGRPYENLKLRLASPILKLPARLEVPQQRN